MAIEFEIEPKLENMVEIESRIRASIQELNLGKSLTTDILHAALQAFSAISLTPVRGPIKVAMGKRGREIRLALAFSTDQNKTPLGLDQALYCPPANRAGYHNQKNRGIWAAFWEI